MPLLVVLALVLSQLDPPGVLSGVVRDQSGRPVRGAEVIARAPDGGERRTTSGEEGRFSLAVPSPGEVALVIRAPGFAELRQTVGAERRGTNLEFVLLAPTLSETVTVTATRIEQRLRDVPASVNVLTQEDIRRSPAVVADDVLRQIPTFSLFRRTSSLASHPTAQGVSLRGIGPSGVSRTLVLLDGVPFNDPFGGWVYWTRIPLESASRIEVVDTPSSSLYGNYAMGGVINIITAPASRRTVDVKAQYGNRNTPKVDIRASDIWGKLGVVLDGAVFSTDGYPIVADRNPAGLSERGLVDKNTSVDFTTLNVKAEYGVSDGVQAFVRGGYFREDRVNGKVSTIDRTDEANHTRWTSASGGVRARLRNAGVVQATLFGDVETFRSNFLAVPPATPPRSVGRMALNQRVPSTSAGGMVQWSRAVGTHNYLTAGTDWRWVDGDSEEDVLDPRTGTAVTVRRVSGGTQRSMGAYVQDVFSPVSALTMTLSARVDRWRNYAGHHRETTVPDGMPTAAHDPVLPEREDTVVSPRVAARYHLTPTLSVWGDIGAGFRAPTLNELYRQFRVGAVLTLANSQLGPERLVGGEFGVTFVPARNLLFRSTYFDNRVKDPVSNVTVTGAGSGILQQRQNLGRTRIRGIQSDAELTVGSSWRVTAGYLYERAEITEDADPTLVGNLLPQVPAHRGSVQVAYSNPRIVQVAFAIQAVGSQFEDDQNVRSVPGLSRPGLPRYTLASLTASRPVGSNVEVFAGVQNVFDEQPFVGTLPTTVGSPRLVTVGMRVRFAGASRP